jgi:Protein of unknown function (DUF2587)
MPGWRVPILADVTNDGHGPAGPDDAERGAVGGAADGRELVQAEVVDRAATDADAEGEHVTRPAKLIRIASMVHSMLDEVRLAPLDDAGRRRLREIHEKSLQELEGILSLDLCAELKEVVLPFTSDMPSESELRLAQAQLVGWLEGLFHGIQAAMYTQQAIAQGQFAEMRRSVPEAASGGERPRPTPSPYL